MRSVSSAKLVSVIFSILLLSSGCRDEGSSPAAPPPPGDPFTVSAWRYSQQYYFLDTSYLALYEPYFQNEPPVVDYERTVRNLEVWISRSGSVPDPNERQAIAYANLPDRPYEGYPESMRSAWNQPGFVEPGPYVRLMEGVDYTILYNGCVGIIRMADPVPDYRAIAVAFASARQHKGEFVADMPTPVNHTTPLILRLVKPRNTFSNGRQFWSTWPLVVKSIYPTFFKDIDHTGFSLDVVLRVPGQPDRNSIHGHRLLEILGFDKYGSDVASGSDGQFDFRPGRTIDRDHGEIVFPYLRPFDVGIHDYFSRIGEVPPDSLMFMHAVYDTVLTDSQLGDPQYVLTGRAIHF